MKTWKITFRDQASWTSTFHARHEGSATAEEVIKFAAEFFGYDLERVEAVAVEVEA